MTFASLRRPVRALAAAVLALTLAGPAAAQAPGSDTLVLQARDAWAKRDRERLAVLKAATLAEAHPLAPWVAYWELNVRLAEAHQPELDAFYERWRGSYVEDRLRNDWLLELGRRRDFANFTRDHAAYRMRDDRDVACYALAADQLAGRPVDSAAARALWLAQRSDDDACHLLAGRLLEAGTFTPDDVWAKLRVAVENGRVRAARQSAQLLGPATAATVGEIVDQPARFLSRRASTEGRAAAELAALALGRMAYSDAEAAAGQLQGGWQRRLPNDLAAWAWALTARQSAFKLSPEAHAQFHRAAALNRRAGPASAWSDDTLAWRVRAALRAVNAPDRWESVLEAVEAMTPTEQKDAAWVYWKARAQLGRVQESDPDATSLRLQALQALQGIAGPLGFYNQLAAEDLRQPQPMPAAPLPPTPDERAAARATAGLQRALQLIGLGLRNEGVREWNFMLRGLDDRALLAAAQWACEREVWDRCINTSDRTRDEIDMAQRYPLPFRADLEAKAREIGLDPAYAFGLIRQESRFQIDARSSVGASGLMQIMPATARWTAGKIGLAYTPDMLTNRDANLRLGTAYLKLVLDDFDGSHALAAAAYNAGPSRARRWREGPKLETAIWAENVPFNETRDYVKKVLSNGAIYAALMNGTPAPALKARLGPGVGPREAAAPPVNEELP